MIHIARSPPRDAILKQELIFCDRLKTGLTTLLGSEYSGSVVALERENPLSPGHLLIPSTKIIILRPAFSSKEARQVVQTRQACSRPLQRN
jgi:hypothetical protein